MDKDQFRRDIQSFYQHLTDKQFLVFTGFYGLNSRGLHLMNSELSALLGVSAPSISQIKRDVENKLSAPQYRAIVDGLIIGKPSE
jgi:hypothetical protein